MGEFEVVLTSDTFPLIAPVTEGANCTTNELVAPAASVSGSVIPLTLYAAPVTLICETVMLALPTLLMTMDFVEELPTATLPKSKVDGLIESTAEGAATPAPVKLTEVGEFVALLTTEICPEALPVTVGANFAV